MKCFNHQLDAVGTCKNCSKGLCRECVVEVGKGLACRNSCEESVDCINKMIDKSKVVYSNSGNLYNSQAILPGLLGSFFICFGILKWNSIGNFLIPLGVISLLSMIVLIRSGRKFKN